VRASLPTRFFFLGGILWVKYISPSWRPIARQRLGKHVPTNTRQTIVKRCFLRTVLCLLLRSEHKTLRNNYECFLCDPRHAGQRAHRHPFWQQKRGFLCGPRWD
jgi:hypothetical protein